MKIFKLISSVAVSALLLMGASHAKAGIPVIDATAIAQQIQQVLAWTQQYQQMIDQFNKLQQQFQQMQTMTNKLDGGRGLGSILQNPAIANALPPEMRDAALMLIYPSASSSSQASIDAILTSFGIDKPGSIAASKTNADALSSVQSILTSTQERQTQLQALGLRVDGAIDAKESLDLLNRNALESATIQNQMIQTMASLAAAEHKLELSRNAESQRLMSEIAAGARKPLLRFGR